ncbi:MAG: hypothetical protein JW927_22175 [Deltaproteobacteria bacterium]|nr:hypothetical protein [Deltaproteobacteria bacterium]
MRLLFSELSQSLTPERPPLRIKTGNCQSGHFFVAYYVYWGIYPNKRENR